MTSVARRTGRANDVTIQQFDARSVLGAWTGFTVVGSPSQCVAVKTTRASLAVGSLCVVLTNTAPSVHVASGGMSVAVAWYASSQRPSVRGIAPVPGLATLAELSHISGRARALFDPRRWVLEVVGTACRFQDYVVEDANSIWRVSGANTNGGDVGENLLKDDGLHSRRPLEGRMLVQTEGELLDLGIGQAIALSEDRGGNAHAVAFDDDVVARCPGRIAVNAQFEFQVFVVGKLLIAEEVVGSDEINGLGVGSVASLDNLQQRIEFEGKRDESILVDHRPSLGVTLECRKCLVRRITGRSEALTRLAVTETRHTSKLVVFVQIEKSRHTPVTILSFGVSFAPANSGVCFTGWVVVLTSSFDASARPTSKGGEVVIVGKTPIALVSTNARFASASAQAVALTRDGSKVVTSAVDAFVVFRLPVVVFFATLAMRTGGIPLTVETMATRSSGSPQLFIKEASRGEVVAVARFAFVSVVRRRLMPRLIIVKRQTFAAVRACSVMFASTNQLRAESLAS